MRLEVQERHVWQHRSACCREPHEHDAHRRNHDDGDCDGSTKRIGVRLTFHRAVSLAGVSKATPGGEFSILVDHRGLEPRTSTMPLWRSPR